MASTAVSAGIAQIRLYHLTFYKCGSQWIRDILTDPRVVEHSGHTLAVSGVDVPSSSWPALEPGQIASPVYSLGCQLWQESASPEDRAFVVVRDPRDIVISLVFSVSTSHTPSAITDLLRDPMSAASVPNRLRIGMFLMAQWSHYLRSWRYPSRFDNVLVTKYEDLIADLPRELARTFAFVGWPIPPAVINAVAAENTFESRSGRKPGDENEYSHRRKGIAGDWRNYFDRDLGEAFENAFPSLLSGLDYEADNDWWRSLPASVTPKRATQVEQRERLQAVLEEHEKELETVRTAAEDRLRDVHILHSLLAEAQAATEQLRVELEAQMELAATGPEVLTAITQQVQELRQQHEAAQHAAEARLQLIHELDRQLATMTTGRDEAEESANERLRDVDGLTAEVRRLQTRLEAAQGAADERLAQLHAAEAARRKLEGSVAWRLGFQPLKAIFSLFRY